LRRRTLALGLACASCMPQRALATPLAPHVPILDAAEAMGTDGWTLWNAGNRYQQDGLAPEDGRPP